MGGEGIRTNAGLGLFGALCLALGLMHLGCGSGSDRMRSVQDLPPPPADDGGIPDTGRDGESMQGQMGASTVDRTAASMEEWTVDPTEESTSAALVRGRLKTTATVPRTAFSNRRSWALLPMKLRIAGWLRTTRFTY